MKASELRIGNWVWDVIDKVGTQMTFDDFQCIDNFLRSNNHPIPYSPFKLNKDWLEKFGFKKNESLNTWEKESWFSIEESYDRDEYKRFEFVFENYQIEIPNIKIDYVHQLQNLYYALTKDELAVAPPCP